MSTEPVNIARDEHNSLFAQDEEIIFVSNEGDDDYTLRGCNPLHDELSKSRERIKCLEECLANCRSVLNACGPLILEHDDTDILTQGCVGAVNWIERVL